MANDNTTDKNPLLGAAEEPLNTPGPDAPPEAALKVELNAAEFAFSLTFEENPSREDICNSIIDVFQQMSLSVMQPKPIGQAAEEIKQYEKKTIVLGGKMGDDGVMDIKIGVIKPQSKIIGGDGKTLHFGTRQQRRAHERKNK